MCECSISLITIMGLIGENCSSCTEAAEDPNGGGLAGSWWRGWAKVSSGHHPVRDTGTLDPDRWGTGQRPIGVHWCCDSRLLCRHPPWLPWGQVGLEATWPKKRARAGGLTMVSIDIRWEYGHANDHHNADFVANMFFVWPSWLQLVI
jgi:hypothetical protein